MDKLIKFGQEYKISLYSCQNLIKFTLIHKIISNLKICNFFSTLGQLGKFIRNSVKILFKIQISS